MKFTNRFIKETIDFLKFAFGMITFSILDYIIVFKFFNLTSIIGLIVSTIFAIIGVTIYFLIEERDEILKWLWKRGIIE
jgi:hypothetical protein